jgi:hypothetical protein
VNKNKHPKYGRTLEDSLKETKDHEDISILVHPFFKDGAGYDLMKNLRLIKYLNAIEIHNREASLYIPSYANANSKAQIFYNKIKEDYKIGAISSSDGHSIRKIGSSYTILKKPNIDNSEELKKSLKESIREHKKFSLDKQYNSYIGAIEHIAKIVYFKTIQKVGIGSNNFEKYKTN